MFVAKRRDVAYRLRWAAGCLHVYLQQRHDPVTSRVCLIKASESLYQSLEVDTLSWHEKLGYMQRRGAWDFVGREEGSRSSSCCLAVYVGGFDSK